LQGITQQVTALGEPCWLPTPALSVIIGNRTPMPHTASSGQRIARPAGEHPAVKIADIRIDWMRQMRRSPATAGVLLAKVLLMSCPALAAGDPTAGEKVFASHCAVCHAAAPGENKIGPSLAGIAGSKSGTVPGFDFSGAMKDANVTWDDANLDKFLANPTGFVHGTKMFVNLPNETDRQNVIAYLNTLKK
jgi:cytochrome c